MKKVVLITGANGMLAKDLAKQLEGEYTIRFLSRNVSKDNEFLWDLKNKYIDPKALTGVHNIIHLAGSSVADKRWTEKRKQDILFSRVASAQLILDALKQQQLTINAFISASAIGYYGTNNSNIIFNEDSPKGNDFLSNVCDKWEQVAHQFQSNRVANIIAIVRIGIILGKESSALQKITKPISFGFGSGIGTGKQFMPWIHIQDLSSIFNYILSNEKVYGIFNAVSPEDVTNIEFTKKIAKVIKRPIILPNIPKFMIELIFGEMGSILLNGNRVSSKKITDLGFKFNFKSLDDALKNLLLTKI